MPFAAVLFALPWLNPFAPGPSPSVVPWLVSAGCALLLALVSAVQGAVARRLPVLPAVMLVAWAALSQSSVRPDVVMLAGGIALVVLSANLLARSDWQEAVQAGVLAAAVLGAAMGLVQYFGVASVFAPWVSGAEAGEAYGNLRQPNLYASLCWLGGAVLLWGTLRIPRALAAVLIALLAVGCAASVSRTGLVQGMVLTALAALWPGPRRQRLVLCAVAGVAYLAAAWLLPFLLQDVLGILPSRTLWARLGGGQACSSRLVLWSNVLHLVAQQPLTGWGWGELDYAHFATFYRGERFCDILDNAHNLPLHLAVELGVPAALLVCGGGLLWGWRRRPWREASPVRQLAWAWIAVMLLHSMLEYPLWYGPFQVLFGVALGWLALTVREPAPVLAGPRIGALATSILLLLATGYAAWDYQRVSQIYLPPEERRAAWRDDTLGAVRQSWLFAAQARFADLTLASLTRENATWMYQLSSQMLHYSPEPRVIERSIESATMLRREDQAVLQLARYRAAFPQDYAKWSQAQRAPVASAPLLPAPQPAPSPVPGASEPN